MTYITVREYAKLFKLSEYTVRKKLREGAIKGRRNESGWFVLEEDVEERITIEEAAKMCGVVSYTMRKYLRNGCLYGEKIGNLWRIPIKEVKFFCRNLHTKNGYLKERALRKENNDKQAAY